jgi:hypothetical protein
MRILRRLRLRRRVRFFFHFPRMVVAAEVRFGKSFRLNRVTLKANYILF